MELIDLCKKEDLHAIAAHFEVVISKTLVNADLKAAVVRLLVDRKVLGTGTAATVAPGSDIEEDEAETEASPWRELLKRRLELVLLIHSKHLI